jgi:hypothetical protein
MMGVGRGSVRFLALVGLEGGDPAVLAGSAGHIFEFLIGDLLAILVVVLLLVIHGVTFAVAVMANERCPHIENTSCYIKMVCAGMTNIAV